MHLRPDVFSFSTLYQIRMHNTHTVVFYLILRLSLKRGVLLFCYSDDIFHFNIFLTSYTKGILLYNVAVSSLGFVIRVNGNGAMGATIFHCFTCLCCIYMYNTQCVILTLKSKHIMKSNKHHWLSSFNFVRTERILPGTKSF